MTIDRRRQFAVLYRAFLSRLIDLEILSTQGDPAKLFGQFAALLAALNFVVAIYLIPRYLRVQLPPAKLALAATGDQLFLIGTTIAVCGMFTVLAWGSVFPTRRDCHILGPLPVGTSTIFTAKIASLAAGVAVAIAAVNVFTAAAYPLVLASSGAVPNGALRATAAFLVTTLAAGAFAFFTLTSLQGIAVTLLPYPLFLRASNPLQIVAFFIVLGGFFLTPGQAEVSIADPAHRTLISMFPAYWFVGLFQRLNGAADPVFAALAGRAVAWLAVSFAISAATFTGTYFHGMRRVVEQPEVTPLPLFAHLSRAIVGRLGQAFSSPLQKAIFLFSLRTLFRSAQHRLILSIYAGIAVAISLAYARNLIYAKSSLYESFGSAIYRVAWSKPNVPLIAIGLVFLYFSVIGVRAVFALPAALPANWIFRTTAVAPSSLYFNAVRRTLYALAIVPVLVAAVAGFLAIWPAAQAIQHLILLSIAAVILAERALRGFRKIPFTCSYLPGNSGLTRRVGIYGALFLFLTDASARIERHALETRARYVVLAAILLWLAVRAHNRWKAFALSPIETLQFEEHEPAEVTPLDLRRDGAHFTPIAAELLAPEPERPVALRIRSALLKGAVCLAAIFLLGAVYEGFEASRQRATANRIGRSVNIGGRSLNYHCLGVGSPTVVFESGGGGEGESWNDIQKLVSSYTRACWYDRAGAAWSDPAPFPRDGLASARDLHALLRAAHLDPPYVLVGASYGGMLVRIYAGLYPEQVAGIVLADSSHIDEQLPIPRPGEWRLPESFYRGRAELAQFLWRAGILRFFFDLGGPFGPRGFAEFAKVPFDETAKQARAAPSLTGVPLIVLTAGVRNISAANPVEARKGIEWQRKWIESQKQLARFSDIGKQLVVDHSRHCIQCDAPETIVNAIREVLQTPRRAP